MPERPSAVYASIRLDPLQTRVDNMLLTRAQPWAVTVGQCPATLRAAPSPVPFSAAGTLHLRCADGLWRVDLGGTDFIRCHPAIAQVPPETVLPEAVLLALLDMILAPLLEPLQRFMGDAVILADARLEPGRIPDEKPAAVAHLILEFDDPGKAPVPLRIAIPDRQSALLLADRLANLPIRDVGRNMEDHQDLPITVCVDAGSMRIFLHELSALEQGDILLPPQYLAAQNRIMLRPCPPASARADAPVGAPGVLCSVTNIQATVITAVTSTQETPMTTTDSSPATPATPGEGQAGLDVGGIEVELCFELERRVMTVKDLAALAPGYTFTLGCDPLAPVSLRINGAVVGSGRLVDINGMLGVQIDSLARSGGQDVRG